MLFRIIITIIIYFRKRVRLSSGGNDMIIEMRFRRRKAVGETGERAVYTRVELHEPANRTGSGITTTACRLTLRIAENRKKYLRIFRSARFRTAIRSFFYLIFITAPRSWKLKKPPHRFGMHARRHSGGEECVKTVVMDDAGRGLSQIKFVSVSGKTF